MSFHAVRPEPVEGDVERAEPRRLRSAGVGGGVRVGEYETDHLS